MIFQIAFIVGLSESIQFENPGIRLELFLKEFSIQSGQSFHCSPYLKDEVLAASFNNQTIDVVKTELARVIHGTWEKKNDGWWLVQTKEQKKQEEQWVWDGRNKTLQAQIDGLKALAPKSEWSIKDAEKYWIDYENSHKITGEGVWNRARRLALRLQSPDSRFCAQVATQLTVKMFTEDPLKLNVNRYSVHGLPGHIELPIDLGPALRQYANERELLRSVSTVEDSDTADQKPAHLEVTYYSGEGQFLFFTWLNKEWKVLGNGIPSLHLPNSSLQVQGEIFPISPPLKEILAYEREISGATKAGPVFERLRGNPVFDEAVSTMFEATKKDPLGIIQGRCWVDFARSVGKPLLVNLKDDEQIIRPQLQVPTVKQSGLVIGMMRDDADGWVLGRPINPLFNRSWRLDRKLIEDYARITRVANTPNFYPLLQRCSIVNKINLHSGGVPNAPFLLDDQNDIGTLPAIVGTLTEDQLNRCLAGATVSMSELSTFAQELVNLNAAAGGFNELTPLNLNEPGQHSPYYCLPNGVTGIRIGASIRIEPEFQFDSEPVEYYGTTLDLETFASLLKDAKKDSGLTEMKFKLGTKRALVATAYLGSKSKSQEISEPIVQKDLPTYTWNTLPEEVRQQVLLAMKKPIK